ncbi:MAG: Rpn family recombination-promoting nuclease/putative transposase [Anaerolineae bacterium]|nr:Rpn family recombination-promoting nuclease/putative transposase [Anaerolineae bacterium]
MTISNPHDRFFRESFSHQETARDFLQHYLPPAVRDHLDLSSLEISKDSFIDSKLQEHFSDLLYKVALRQGGETYIYVLFEHKSYPDPLIAFQLLRYMVRIWEQALKQQEKLLPVLPVVMYHGQAKWQVNLNFVGLFDLPEALQPFVPDYEYWLCDLSQYSDIDIKAGVERVVILQVGLLLLKYIWQDDVRDRLKGMVDLLRELGQQETGLEYIRTVLRYVSAATDKITAAELEEIVIEAFTEGEALMPTIAEQWIEQGRIEGLEKGREEGLEEGREEGREAALMLLRRFLKYHFGLPLDHFDQQLATLDLAALTQLSDVAFEVDTLAEFEATLAELQAKLEDTNRNRET